MSPIRTVQALSLVAALPLAGCTAELKEENSRLKEKVSNLEAENSQLQGRVDGLQKKLDEAKAAAATAARAAHLQETGIDPDQPLTAVLHTSKGKLTCALFPAKAPKTVANFVGLAEGTKEWTDPRDGQVKKGVPLYDGTIFHRVIPDFMIQAGDPLGRGTGGPGYKFEDEIVPDLKLDKPGILAMANSGPNTNGSQFFVTEKATPWLNGKHTVFGECKEVGLVKEIARVPKNPRDKPLEDVVLEKVEIKRGKS